MEDQEIEVVEYVDEKDWTEGDERDEIVVEEEQYVRCSTTVLPHEVGIGVELVSEEPEEPRPRESLQLSDSKRRESPNKDNPTNPNPNHGSSLDTSLQVSELSDNSGAQNRVRKQERATTAGIPPLRGTGRAFGTSLKHAPPSQLVEIRSSSHYMSDQTNHTKSDPDQLTAGLLHRLFQKIEKLEDRVHELEAENKRLSSSFEFSFLDGSERDLIKDLAETSLSNLSLPHGIERSHSLPTHVMAALTSSLLASTKPQQKKETKEITIQSAAQKRWGLLEKVYEESSCLAASRKKDLVFLHPEEVGKRNYSVNELCRVGIRPFPSRLFITNVQLEWNTVWLRTRHTDHHVHNSSFIQVRDAFKADAITSNPPGAKYALTELLNMCYGMKDSDYHSFACTLASAFSNQAANTEFEKSLLLHPARMEQIDQLCREESIRSQSSMARSRDFLELEVLRKEQERSRKKLTQLLHIVFSKLKQKRLLVDDNKDNIYRLVLCMTKYRRKAWRPYFYAFFSFFFQLCAGLYVALSLTNLDDEDGCGISIKEWNVDLVYQNLALAIGTICYGCMVALPEMWTAKDIYQSLYRSQHSVISTIDFIVNGILPIIIALCGFLVVLQAESFLEGVLNAVALIFITEIDDQLPKLLELDKKDIVQGFLIDQAMEEYKNQDLLEEIPSIEFSDMHITNTPESGSIPTSGVTFQPYEVKGYAEDEVEGTIKDIFIDALSNRTVLRKDMRISYAPDKMTFGNTEKAKDAVAEKHRKGDMGQQVANKRSVTVHCLLRKIEWQYTGDPKRQFEAASSPRIGHLILHKIIGGAPVNIKGKQKAPPEINKPWFSITGVYIITSFSMSDDVLR
jgi:hypothetical protein